MDKLIDAFDFSPTRIEDDNVHHFDILDSDSGRVLGVCHFNPETMDEWSHDIELSKSLDVDIYEFSGFAEEQDLKDAILERSGSPSKAISKPTPSRPPYSPPKLAQERKRSGKKLRLTVTKWRSIDDWDLAIYEDIVRSPEIVLIHEVAVRDSKVVIVGDVKRLAVDNVSLNGVELILDYAGTVTATFYKENSQ